MGADRVRNPHRDVPCRTEPACVTDENTHRPGGDLPLCRALVERVTLKAFARHANNKRVEEVSSVRFDKPARHVNAESPCRALKPGDRGAAVQWFGEIPNLARRKIAGSKHLAECHQRRAFTRRAFDQCLGAGPTRLRLSWRGDHLDRRDSQRAAPPACLFHAARLRSGCRETCPPLVNATAATTTHRMAVSARFHVKKGAPISGGWRISVLAERLACMSITTSRLAVRSYTHTMSTRYAGSAPR